MDALSKTFPGIDGVLANLDGRIYAVQATIAGAHEDPMTGIMKLWNGFHQRREVHARGTFL